MKLTPKAYSLTLLALFANVLPACGSSTRNEPEAVNRYIPGVALIDDMEDGNTQTMEDVSGFLGFWFTYNDHKDCIKETYCCDNQNLYDVCTDPITAGCAGTMTPDTDSGADFTMSSTAGLPADPAVQQEVAASTQAARITGQDFGLWGAGMGFALNETSPFAIPAEYTGIRFLAIAPAAGPDGLEVAVKINDSSSNAGVGNCIPRTTCSGDGSSQGCYDDFGAKVTVTNTWQVHEIPFSTFTRVDNYGSWVPGAEPVGFNQTQAYQVTFQVGQGAFDLLVDNVGFTMAAMPPAGG